jgi:hypothetical protein
LDLETADIGGMIRQRLDHKTKDVDELRLARNSFKDYLTVAGRTSEGKPLEEDHASRFLADLMEYCFDQRRHLSLVAMPGFRKSTQARLFAVYRLGRNPNTATVIVSGDVPVAESAVAFCRNHITTSRFQEIFKNVKPDTAMNRAKTGGDALGWRKDKFFVRPIGEGQRVDPAFEAVAADPSSEARRVDILLADDMMTRKIANSSAERKAKIDAFKGTWMMGRLANGGWAMAIQNIWHVDDLAHLLASDARFCSVWVGVNPTLSELEIRVWNPPAGFPAIENPDQYLARVEDMKSQALEVIGGETKKPPLHDYTIYMPLPEIHKFSREAMLADYRADTENFNRLWRFVASAPGDRMFSFWKKRQRYEGTVSQMLVVDKRGTLPVFSPTDRMRFVFGIGIDFSGESRPGDFIAVWGMNRERYIFPVEFHKGNFTASEFVEILTDMWLRGIWFGCGFLENNAVQSKFITEVKVVARSRKVPWIGALRAFQTGKNKADPGMGVGAINVEMQNGYVLWPAGESTRTEEDADHAEVWRSTEQDFETCPRFIEPGKSPDSIMASWFARMALNEIAFGAGQNRAILVAKANQNRLAPPGY